MQVITTQTKVYPFEELSSKAKERVRQWWSDMLDTESWAEPVIEDAKQVAALMGWEVLNVFFSGFWSQGDGACFVGHMRYAKGCAKAVKEHAPLDEELHRIAKAWQDLQAKHFYSLEAQVYKTCSRYSHENTVAFSVEDTRSHRLDGAVEESVEEIGKDFMRWIYKALESAHDMETGMENVAEICETNSYLFREDGTRFEE